MAWTVPTGCYYCVWVSSNNTFNYYYYNAGQSVPNERAPYSTRWYVLVDFTHGYIYTCQFSGGTLNIASNNTFTYSQDNPNSSSYAVPNVIAGDYCCLQLHNITLTGNTFTFGDGTGIMDTSTLLSGYSEMYMLQSFRGRTDIISAVIPDGVAGYSYTFRDCTSLTSVTGTINATGKYRTAVGTFYGCSSLVSVPSFTTSGDGNMESCFEGCSSLTTPPTIPNGITSLVRCFVGCTSLVTPPTIPASVTNINSIFKSCTFTTAPTIPSSVTNMQQCFWDCSSLAGVVTIDANPTYYSNVFYGTSNLIVLKGTSTLLDTIASQQNNVYVYSLNATITATRNESTPTNVNIAVTVSRFRGDNDALSSITLKEDGSTISPTWNDPTLTMSSATITFTTTVTNVAEGDTPMFSIVVADAYGTTEEVSVRVPIAFYTIDVQAGGKEIAFGAIASDSLTNHPNGLFRCDMDTQFEGNNIFNGDATCQDMTSQEVDDFVDSLSYSQIVAVDYVVEQGISGMWTYRKWNSGIAECWGIYTASIAVTTASAGYGGYRSAEISVEFPITFISIPATTAVIGSGSQGAWLNNSQPNTTNWRGYLSSAQSNAATSRSIHIHAIGTWK